MCIIVFPYITVYNASINKAADEPTNYRRKAGHNMTNKEYKAARYEAENAPEDITPHD